ncbi:inorganic pyrophosphatase [Pavlovales sp. CCMP2436]|nr:inorganic pyrophosphatase [Pavlovales sp. CCMP2436]
MFTIATTLLALGAHRPGSLQRLSALRGAATRTLMALPTATAVGEPGTEAFKVNFAEGGKPASPWHDVPLEAGNGLYNMITEIPKYTTAKMEIDTKSPNNPIVQDEKKGKLRYYHGCIFWNYGCLPQTWEDPNVKGSAEVGGAFGDNDPIDVVEIGSKRLEMGSITPVKAIGVLSMIDDGELDWKVIAIAANDPMAAEINDVADLEAKMPGVVSGIREWFRWYKTPDDKPLNGFGHGEKCLGAAEAKHAIEETHGFYKDLIAGKSEKGKLWLPSA